MADFASKTVRVTPPAMIEVTAARYSAVPLFRPKLGGWLKGVQLNGVKAQETTSPHLLDPGSFTLRAGPEADAPLFARGVDYEVDLEWGTFGRLAEGHIALDAAVFASYRHAQLRLDAIVLMPDGQIQLRPGEPRAAAPAVPRLQAGERHLGSIYLPGFIAKLEPDHLFIALFGPALIYSNHSECSPAHGVGNCEKIDLAIAFDIPSLTVGVRYQPLTNPDGNGGDPRSGFFHGFLAVGHIPQRVMRRAKPGRNGERVLAQKPLTSCAAEQ